MTEKQHKKRIILNVNHDKPENIKKGQNLLQWLQKHAEIVAENVISGDSINWPSANLADYVVVLGGDGTILSTVRAMNKNQIPLSSYIIPRPGQYRLCSYHVVNYLIKAR